MTQIRSFLAVVLISLLHVWELSGQTPLQIQWLNDFAARNELEWDVQQAEAETAAVHGGFPISVNLPDGTTMRLVRLDHGLPIYVGGTSLPGAKTVSTDSVWPDGGAGFSLTGDGITFAMWDAEGVYLGHPEFEGRIQQLDGATPGVHIHATQVAGILTAAGLNPNAKGMAYKSHVLAFDLVHDRSEMAYQAAAGLRLSNHSYGQDCGWRHDDTNYPPGWIWLGDVTVSETEEYRYGFYDILASKFDSIAYAAPYYLIVRGAGNDRDPANLPKVQPVKHMVFRNGGLQWDSTTVIALDGGTDGYDGYDCMNDFAVSKNVMTVGAIHPIITGYHGPSSAVMTDFSSWGPTDDGRIKPDVVGDGYDVLSTGFDSSYSPIQGTSASSPNITGSIALLLQHEKNIFGSNKLLASTYKGLVIHTAREAGTTLGPDYKFGWGVMNTLGAAQLMQTELQYPGTSIKEIALSQSQTYDYQVRSLGIEPLRATICWTDPPHDSLPRSIDPPTPVLINDLDLRILGPSGTTYYPYKLDRNNPSFAATTGDNTVDNVEQVHIQTPVAGLYTVRITHKGTLIGSPQLVSLIVTGHGIVNVTVDQRLQDEMTSVDSIGRWEGSDFADYGVPKVFGFIDSSTQVLRGTRKIISGQKYNNWNSLPDVTNHHTFNITAGTASLTSNLIPTQVDILTRTQLIDVPSAVGGYLGFKDPWLIDSIDAVHGNAPLNRGPDHAKWYDNLSSPFYPDTTHTYNGFKYNGVFLNQFPPVDTSHPPYYSVRVPQLQTIGAYQNCNFIGWSADSAQFQNSDALETPVVFTGAGATVTALYKGNLLSSIPSTLGGNNQHKVIFSATGPNVLVYESGGEIWLTYQEESGWINEVLVSDGTGGNHSPAINEYYSDRYWWEIVWVGSDGHVHYRLGYPDFYNLSVAWQGPETIPSFVISPAFPSTPVVANGWIAFDYPSGGTGSTVVLVKRLGVNSFKTDIPSIPGATSYSSHPSILAKPGDCHIVFQETSSDAILHSHIHIDNDNNYIWDLSNTLSSADGRATRRNPVVSNMSGNDYGAGKQWYCAWDAWNSALGKTEVVVRIGDISGTSVDFKYFNSGSSSFSPWSYTSASIRELGNGDMILSWISSDNTTKAAVLESGNWCAFSPSLAASGVPTVSNNGLLLSVSGAQAPYSIAQTYFDPFSLAATNYSLSSTATKGNGQRKLAREASTGTLHIVFESQGEIFYRNSISNGSNWSLTCALSDGTGLNASPCITEKGGSVFVVWQKGTSPFDVLYTYSTDGGYNWVSPIVLATGLTTASPGPLPVIQTSSTAFAILAVYRTSTGLKSARSTTNPPTPASWTTQTVAGTTALAQNPSLLYHTTGYPYQFELTWDNGTATYEQAYYNNSWQSANCITCNAASLLGITNTQRGSYALSTNGYMTGDRQLTTEGVHDGADVILYNRNLSTTVYTEFRYGNPFNHYYNPVITGHGSSHATLLWWATGWYPVIPDIRKTSFNGSTWSTVEVFGNTARYPTVSTTNPAGGPAYAFWTEERGGSQYAVVTSAEGGPLQKGSYTLPWQYSRTVAIGEIGGDIPSYRLELIEPTILTLDGTETTLHFTTVDDTMRYCVTDVPNLFATEAFSLKSTGNLVVSGTQKLDGVRGNVTYLLYDTQTGQTYRLEDKSDSLARNPDGSVDLTLLGQTLPRGHYLKLLLSTPLQTPAQPLESIGVAILHKYTTIDSSNLLKRRSRVMDLLKLLSDLIPTSFTLAEPYPNPFNPSVTIRFGVPTRATVSVKIYSLLGEEIATLYDGMAESGYHEVRWNASSRANGIYYVRMIEHGTEDGENSSAHYHAVKKLVLLK